MGDGRVATTANVIHHYEREGTYVATVTVSNPAGETSRTLTHTVAAPPVDPCVDVVELASAFFDANSSVLTGESRRNLSDNADALRGCPSLSVRIEGFASPRERARDALSLARANAVLTFYRDAGLPDSALAALVSGTAGTLTTRKDDGSVFRRVDSIILR